MPRRRKRCFAEQLEGRFAPLDILGLGIGMALLADQPDALPEEELWSEETNDFSDVQRPPAGTHSTDGALTPVLSYSSPAVSGDPAADAAARLVFHRPRGALPAMSADLAVGQLTSDLKASLLLAGLPNLLDASVLDAIRAATTSTSSRSFGSSGAGLGIPSMGATNVLPSRGSVRVDAPLASAQQESDQLRLAAKADHTMEERTQRVRPQRGRLVADPSYSTLNTASPATEIVTPYPRVTPDSSQTFDGEFVVRLKKMNASSEQKAANLGFEHEFAYPNLADNVNVWQIPEDVDPETSLGRWLRRGYGPERMAEKLENRGAIVEAYPVYQSAPSTRSFLNDPLLPAQWHLANNGHTGGTVGVDANVLSAWDLGVSGQGVTIAVVDEGVQSTHGDLAAHYNQASSYDFVTLDDDPSPDAIGEACSGGAANAECHGTAVAGVAAGIGDNNLGGAGAAPNATIGSLKILSNAGGAGATSRAEALAWNTTKPDGGNGGFDAATIDISNNSWGFSGGGLVSSLPETTAVQQGAVLGRGGLGTIYVFAGGNDRQVVSGEGNVNYTSGLHNSRHVIAVAAVTDDGDFASYSNPGAPLLISAPSNGSGEGITTADLVETNAASTNGYRRTDYTDNFGGTSSATPLVSGVIALMLEANPNLTARDVQHILVESADRDGLNAGGWAANLSGREFSHDFGFGLVNAAAAVTLASNWKSVPPEVFVNSGRQLVNQAVADLSTVSDDVNITSDILVESVEVVFNATHTERDDLEVTLEHVGVTTTTSELTETRVSDAGDDYSNFVLTSRAHWGESSTGTWRLSVRDGDGNAVTGTFDDWTLRIYGTAQETDVDGPRVARAEVTAKQLDEGKVTGFQVQFDESIAGFAAADIDFRPVGGSAIAITSVTAVAGSNNTTFDVAFAEQSAAGNYRIDIGPNVMDSAGNSMNQDGDETNGEATEDQFTSFFTIGNRFIFSNSNAGAIPDNTGGSLDRLFATPALNVGDLNVLLNVTHNAAANDLVFLLAPPGAGALTYIAHDSTPPGFSHNGNGYLDAVIDDEASTQIGTGVDYDFTGSWQPRDFAGTGATLANFNGNQAAGNWTLRSADGANAGFAGTFRYASLIVTPGGTFDISLDSVTNTDGDRDKVEVTYTVSDSAGGNGTAPSFDLVGYDSTDPVFNINSDTKIGAGVTVTNTSCSAGAGCLTGGPHTLELDASVFVDPDFDRSTELFSLLVVDPEHNVADSNRYNNRGILSGVTLTPDGTLHIAGNPFAANTVTISNPSVNLNGTVVSYDPAATNDVFFTGSTEGDTFSASGVSENILGFLGAGDDTYTGGDLIDAVQGGPGADNINGKDGADRLFGMSGDDIVDGESGADIVSVGRGGLGGQTQSLVGGTGNDFLLIGSTEHNDRINVWDPDEDETQAGSSLRAVVSTMAGAAAPGALINGPDNFGYTAYRAPSQDIDLVNGGAGVTSVVNGTSSINSAFDLGGHTFNFYGTSYTGNNQLFVSPNGWITFGSAFSFEFNNINFLSQFFEDRSFIAPFMDDLTTFFTGTGATDSEVLANLDGGNNLLTIEWSDVRNQSIDAVATFQVILELNTGSRAGDITFNYTDVDFGDATYDNGASATVGIQNVSGTAIVSANQLVLNGAGPASSLLQGGSAFVLSTNVGLNPGVTHDIDISGVDSTDILLVNASFGDDTVDLKNDAVLNSKVGLNSVLIGGPGGDTIYDGLGADTLIGDSSTTSVFPNDGVDSLTSSDDGMTDKLYGTTGVDSLNVGGPEDDGIFISE